MTNREQYERMIYLDPHEVELIMYALIDAWYTLPEPDDYDARTLYHKIAEHYHIKERAPI